MSHKFLFNTIFHSLLAKIDQEFATEACQKGCFYCGSQLHQANYPRSPIGMPSQFRDYYDERLSFCCDSCRKRTTPKSVRFFGRRWFPAPLFILISVLTVGINERRLAQVKRHLDIVMSGIVFTVVSLFFANAIKRLAGVVHAELTKNIDLEDRQQQDHHLGAYFDPKNKPQDGLLGALGTVVDGFGEFFHDITHSSKEIPENPVPLIKPPANYDLIM